MLDLTEPQDGMHAIAQTLGTIGPSNMADAALRSWVVVCEWENDEGDIGLNVRTNVTPWAAMGLLSWANSKESLLDDEFDCGNCDEDE